MGFGGVLAAAVLLGGVQEARAVVTSTQSATYNPVFIVDASTGEVSFTFTGLPTATNKVVTTVGFTKCDDPINTVTGACEGQGNSFNSEIRLFLISPQGTIRTLIGNNYTGQTPGAQVVFTFDDSASTLVGGSTLISGTYRPNQTLSAFNGQDPNGTWRLRFQDTVAIDPLSVNRWSLTVAAVPAPLPLLGAGAAFAWSRRLRQRIQRARALPVQL